VPYKQIGVAEGHHDLSHHGRDPLKQEKLQKINTFHIQQLAYVLEKMQSIKEDEGTLLDNTMPVYGAGISGGDRHNHDDLPILLAGKVISSIPSFISVGSATFLCLVVSSISLGRSHTG
jgi:hypothetical protein